ncbi:KTSC domain-containing protein [Thalassospira xiamenensis]|uniref:KTSC domain-containing protein n=1 Tax=Thalassospira xiamenensis TaxID=220697 RepID=UPI003B9680AB
MAVLVLLNRWAVPSYLSAFKREERVPYFNSTAISRAEYDEPTQVLQLWFVDSGGPYSYYRVPKWIFDGLCQARSKGGYYNRYIRDKF